MYLFYENASDLCVCVCAFRKVIMVLMMMVGEMTQILWVEVVVVSHGSLEAARNTHRRQHLFRIQIQVGNKRNDMGLCRECHYADVV